MTYPFNEGDTYYTIENGAVVESTWDSISEELHYPTKKYYSTFEEAKSKLSMKNIIIAQVPESDRNIYLTIVDGELYSVNYSQGIDDIDLHFATTHNQGITQFVYNELQKQGDDLYSIDCFFPSPYWDQQVKVIDDAIWKLIKQENERADLINAILHLEQQLEDLKSRL